MNPRTTSPLLWPNPLLVVACWAGILYLLGMSGLQFGWSNRVADTLLERIPFTIEIKAGVSEAQLFEYQKQLEQQPFVKPGSVRFISKREGLESLGLAADSAGALRENPLPDVLQFQLRGAAVAQCQTYVAELKKAPEVADVWYMREALENPDNILQTTELLRRRGWGLLAVCGLLGVVGFGLLQKIFALLWLRNLPALQMQSLAGAMPQDIRRPFWRQNLIWGLSGAGVALVLLIATAWFYPHPDGGDNVLLVLGWGLAQLALGAGLSAGAGRWLMRRWPI